MTKTLSGLSLLLLALAMFVYNASDIIEHLRDWHDATTPAIAAVLLKRAAMVVLAALGGTLMPPLGGGK